MSEEYYNNENKGQNTESETSSQQTGQNTNGQSRQTGQNTYGQSRQTGQNTYGQSQQGSQNAYGQQHSGQNTYGQYQQGGYSWTRNQNTQGSQQHSQQNWNGQPHYNYYQRQQMNAQQTGSKKQKSRWATVVAMALVFGLIAGTVSYGVNLAANRIYPAVPQTEAAAETPQKESTVSLARTQSEDSGSTEQAVDTTSADGTQTVAQVAENAMPALVTIATVSVQEMQSFFGVQQYEAQGAGTGVIVGENDTELLIATNEHVISGANEVSVGFIDEEVVSAQIKGEDVSTDLAIVSVKKEDIPEETLSQIKIAVIGNSDDLVLGEQVVAIGNALGVGQSVTSGYVSALGRELDLSDGTTSFVSSDLIQTDAAINSGNSGGALLNMKGELVGINEAKSAYTSSGVTVDNVGYAIPMSKAEPILEELMNQVTRESYGEDEQGYLGVSLADVSSDMAQLYNMPEGVCFTAVAPGSPAEEAGARKGDVLTEVNGRSITSSSALMKEMTYYKSGETVEMKVLRADNGEYKEVTLTVTLGTKDVLEPLSENN